MSDISATAVMALRNRTNAAMMDCKAALTEAAGDMEKAVEILRKKNASIVAKKAGRETAEGRIAIFIDPDKKVGAIVEMRCESAPVAKTKEFTELAQKIAKMVAEEDQKAAPQKLIEEATGVLSENMKLHRSTRLTGLLGGYVHHDGSVGVLLQVEGAKADPQVLRDICMHITAKNPAAAKREDVSADLIEKEKEIARSQAAATGKPANIVEKIVEGKMKTWFADNVLLEQPFVKDDSKTVNELLKSAGLTFGRFVRYKVGELS